MKFNVLLALAAVLSATSEACKCGGNIDATRACCTNVGGVPTSNDCPANTISERLSNFASCCNSLGTRSDCRCPVGCAKAELEASREAQGLAPLSDAELLQALDTYEG